MHNHEHGHEHGHGHGRVHSHGNATEHNLKIGIVLNLAFAAFEVAVGILSNSVAILSDAVHDFADSGSLFVALIAERISRRPADPRRTFGYRRASILAALLNASVLLVSTGWIAYSAVVRIFQPVPVESDWMLLVAGVSIVINGVAAVRLHADRTHNLNAEGAFWHLLEDALGGLVLLVGGLVIRFTGWFWVDSVLGIALAALVVRGALRIVMRSVHILLEGTPRDIDPERVKEALLEHPSVCDVHHLHIWMLDTDHYNMSVHVNLISRDLPADLYKELSERVVEFKIRHLTVQAEGPDGDCLPCRR